jgi:SAM-dependent methyltransferase
MGGRILSGRPCPVCDCHKCDAVHKSVVTVVCCQSCGMVFNDATEDVDYSRSRYAAGFEEWNQERYRQAAERFSRLGINTRATILDVGCATGGLMEALENHGYAPEGIDPDPKCAEAALAGVGTLMDLKSRWDVVILSHVLEHIRDVRAAMQKLREVADSVYIEVPNAQRYVDNEVSPYQQWNKEHVNHFDMFHLQSLFAGYGFQVRACGEYECNPANSPAMWAWFCRDKSLRQAANLYGDRSAQLMHGIEQRLAEVKGPVIAWGIGSLARRLESMLEGKLLYSIDANVRPEEPSTYYGKRIVLGTIEKSLRADVPILVTTILHKDAVLADIKRLGLTNPVITL